ncbi:MAG TPA: hypothetical protein VEZ15_10495 [Acidimicrobiia bacterium]|nr:hypothetical protein [Acidimicrobiia bacterium]
MPDALERHLAAGLQAVAGTVPDDLAPPPGLEQRVAKVRNRRRGVTLLAALSAVAAVVIAALTIAAITGPAPAPNRVDVSGPGSTADPLVAGTVMLDSRASFVVAVGADGSQVATLVNAARGVIVDAQLTRDHRWLWYLSVAKTKQAGAECGEVVRADIMRGTSTIVAHAVSFAISPDGTRLALAGGGDGAGPACLSLTGAAARASVVVTDLASQARSTWTDEVGPRVTAFNQMRWSNDGRSIVTRICAKTCASLVAYDVPANLGAPLHSRTLDRSGFPGETPSAAFGPDGSLFVLERNVAADWRDHVQSLVVYDAATLAHPTTELRVDFHWDLKEVVPTEAGTFVVVTERSETGQATGPTALYRVEHGNLVAVKRFADFGVVTPVFSRP